MPKPFAILLALGALHAAWIAQAQDYPAKPVRIIVQFTAGSTTDIFARLLAARLTETWGQQVIVDNRPGAGGSLGTGIGAKAAPDGYTLTMAVSSAFGINPGLYSKLPYDAIKDFAPIANLAVVAQTLVTNPALPVRSVQELVKLAKARPGELNHASLGSGSTSHLTMEMFKTAAAIKMNHVPFKGAPEAHAQVIGGQVELMFDAMPAVKPQIEAKKLRGLAVSTKARSLFLPELPTIAESGYPGYEAVGWVGVVVPAKVPEAILDKLQKDCIAALNHPDTKARLAQMAFTPVGEGRAEFARFIQNEIAKWTKAVKDSGAKVD